MDIPIHNTLFDNNKKYFKKKSYNLNLSKLNNLSLQNVKLKKFPVVKILKLLPRKSSLFETALVSANDHLVQLYLKKKIKYHHISTKLFKIINLKEIKLLKNKTPKNVNEILKINSYVKTKVMDLSI